MLFSGLRRQSKISTSRMFSLRCNPCRKVRAGEAEGKHSIVEENELDERRAEGIDARELHMIFTRSNELIWIVDARSEEEFDRMHISGALSLVRSNDTRDH